MDLLPGFATSRSRFRLMLIGAHTCGLFARSTSCRDKSPNVHHVTSFQCPTGAIEIPVSYRVSPQMQSGLSPPTGPGSIYPDSEKASPSGAHAFTSPVPSPARCASINYCSVSAFGGFFLFLVTNVPIALLGKDFPPQRDHHG